MNELKEKELQLVYNNLQIALNKLAIVRGANTATMYDESQLRKLQRERQCVSLDTCIASLLSIREEMVDEYGNDINFLNNYKEYVKTENMKNSINKETK